MSDLERRLDGLWRQYRAACPEPEPSASFSPELWQRIEMRRGFRWYIARYSRRLAAAGAAACLALFAVEAVAVFRANPVYQMTYIDTLEQESAPESMAYAHTLTADYVPVEAQR